jgi:hypothetical protein
MTQKFTSPKGYVGKHRIGSALGISNTWGAKLAERSNFPAADLTVKIFGRDGGVFAYWEVGALTKWWKENGKLEKGYTRRPANFAGTKPKAAAKLKAEKPAPAPKAEKVSPQKERAALPKVKVGKVAVKPEKAPKRAEKPAPAPKAPKPAPKAEKPAKAAPAPKVEKPVKPKAEPKPKAPKPEPVVEFTPPPPARTKAEIVQAAADFKASVEAKVAAASTPTPPPLAPAPLPKVDKPPVGSSLL